MSEKRLDDNACCTVDSVCSEFNYHLWEEMFSNHINSSFMPLYTHMISKVYIIPIIVQCKEYVGVNIKQQRLAFLCCMN